MSIHAVREAFNLEGQGKATCTSARLRYIRIGGKEHQVLEFDGVCDGKPFSLMGDPTTNNLFAEARKLARFLLDATK